MCKIALKLQVVSEKSQNPRAILCQTLYIASSKAHMRRVHLLYMVENSQNENDEHHRIQESDI